MILLIGSSGFIGSAFSEELTRLGIDFISISHLECVAHLKNHSFELVINCAAFIPSESVSLCDDIKAVTLRGNLLLPSELARICDSSGIPFAQISTGFLWSDGLEHSEDDEPQRAFSGYSGFYIGAKVLAEEEVRKYSKHYIWRVSLAFDESNHYRNYLVKLASLPKVFDCENTITHRRDFSRACLALWISGAAYGTYNVMNLGAVRAVDIVNRMLELGIRKTHPEILTGEGYNSKANMAKLLHCGVAMRPALGALEESFRNWGH